MTIGMVDATLVAEDTFTNEIPIFGLFNISISGIAGDTVSLQRSYDEGTTWKLIEEIVADVEDYGYEPERGILYRLGVLTGDFSAGTILARLSF